MVRALGPRSPPPRDALRQVRRRPVREGDRYPRRLVRLGVQPRRRPRDAARAPVAGGDVHRGLGPAPRLVPVLAPRIGRHPRRAAVQGRHHARILRGRRGTQDVQVPRELHRAGRACAQVWRRDPASLGDVRGLYAGHPGLPRDPGPPRGRVSAHPQHVPVPPGQPVGLRPGGSTRSTGGSSTDWVGSSAA